MHKYAISNEKRSSRRTDKFGRIFVKRIDETLAIWEELEEAIERLQVVAAQDGRVAHPVAIGIFGRGSMLQLFDNLLRHLIHYRKEGKDK